DARRRRLALAAQAFDDGDESTEGVGNADDGEAIGRQVLGDDGSGGAASGQVAGLVIVLDEGDVAGVGLAEGTGLADRYVAVSVETTADQFRQLADGDSHVAPTFSSLRCSPPLGRGGGSLLPPRVGSYSLCPTAGNASSRGGED